MIPLSLFFSVTKKLRAFQSGQIPMEILVNLFRDLT